MKLSLSPTQFGLLTRLAPNWSKVITNAEDFQDIVDEDHTSSAGECMEIIDYSKCMVGEIYCFTDAYSGDGRRSCNHCDELSDAIGLFCFTLSKANPIKEFEETYKIESVEAFSHMIKLLLIHMEEKHPSIIKRKTTEYNKIQKNLGLVQ